MKACLWSLPLFFLLFAVASAQTVSPDSCPTLDAADEPNHSLLYRNNAVRIFEVQLPRIKASQPHCHQNTYVLVVTSESRTTDGGISTDWTPGDTRLVYGPSTSNIRNEQSAPYRAIEIETLRTVTYSWSLRNQYADPFGADMGTVKPSWTQTFARGGLAGTRAQLASGDSFDVNSPDHILIAITALDLEVQGETSKRASLDRGDTLMLPGGSASKLVNQGPGGAKFVIMEF